MGIIVADTLDVQYGLKVSNCYVNIHTLKIFKQLEHTRSDKHIILANCHYFVSQEQRLANESHFREIELIIYTDKLDNVYEQVYTELKSKFENYTDCI